MGVISYRQGVEAKTFLVDGKTAGRWCCPAKGSPMDLETSRLILRWPRCGLGSNGT